MDSSSYTSDLNLTRIQTTETTFLGRRRTLQSLSHFEKVFIGLTLLTLTASLVFTIYRLSTLPTISADFTVAFLFLLNIVFCYFYTIHGVLYEQPYEMFVLVVTTLFLLIYLVLSYSKSEISDSLKSVRLVLMSIISPIIAISAIGLGAEYHKSGNLVFRTVGADPNMQSMCRKLQRAIVLIVFDAQAVGSCLMLILYGAEFSTSKIILLSFGFCITVVWSIIGFIGMYKEKSVCIWIFLTISPVQPAYVIWQIVVTGLYQSNNLIEISVYISGTLLLLIHIYLFINTVQVYLNFGKGLQERVFEIKTSSPRLFSTYGSIDGSTSSLITS